MKSMRGFAILIALLATVSACQDSVIKALGPENTEIATVLIDSLRYQAEDLDNVTDTRSWTWIVSRPAAIVHHRSFVHHGQGRLTIIDAAGDTVYRKIPLEYQLDNETAAGQAGLWTVKLELFGARGRVDFSLARKP